MDEIASSGYGSPAIALLPQVRRVRRVLGDATRAARPLDISYRRSGDFADAQALRDDVHELMKFGWLCTSS